MLQLTITFTPSHRDRIHSTLNDLGILSLVEGTPDSGLTHTADTVTCYPESPEHEQKIRSVLSAAFATDKNLQFTSTPLPDTNWISAWKEHWKPIEVTNSLWISPSWCEFSPPPNSKTIWLDTTTAFGTGTHETTRLCLRLLEKQLNPRLYGSFLDIGCGSGVLSIYARMLGVHKVTGIDIDPQAVETSRLNAGRNGFGDITFLTGRADRVGVTASFVTANILSGIIRDSWQAITHAVETGGTLVLSGILTSEVDEFTAALGITPKQILTEGEWCTLLLQPGPAPSR